MRRITLPTGWSRALGLGLLLLTTPVACKDFLKVSDPQRFTNEALDNEKILVSVANGVEGQFQQDYDDIVVFTGLLSDELINSSTWIDWDDISTGRITGDWATAGAWGGSQDEMLRTRYSAQDAAARITRVLGGDAAGKSKLMAQVKVYEAWADLVLGMAFCESPLAPGAARSPDLELYKQAVTKFGAALTVATAAGSTEWANFALAGRARANLLAGNYDAALADAQSIPAGFIKQAVYSENSAVTWGGQQLHYNRNRSGGLNTMYWPAVDTSNAATTASPVQYVKDPWSNLNDARMAVSHPKGLLGVNNTTKHYGIQKYADRTNPITLTSKREMNLIEAEVYWRKGQLTQAIDALNRNRTTAPANLPAFDATGLSAQQVFDRLLSERFAELFVEGHRMTDLDRFNLVTAKLGPGRAKKLPMSRNEIINNANMHEGDAKCPGRS